MGTAKEFFCRRAQDAPKGVSQKNDLTKRAIITHMATGDSFTLAELADALSISVPTTTKLVAELVAESIVSDFGKVETPGGRRPNIFGLSPSAIYFAGADISDGTLTVAVTDIHNETAASKEITTLPDNIEKTIEIAISETTALLRTAGIDHEKVLGYGFSFNGQVDTRVGTIHGAPDAANLRNMLEERLGTEVHIENSTRARAYADYIREAVAAAANPATGTAPDDSIYVSLDDSVSLAIITDGRPYYGNSGLAGSFGHTPLFDNGTICSCGKKGCLDTEVSVRAIAKRAADALAAGHPSALSSAAAKPEGITVADIIAAVETGDSLATELIEDAAAKAGRGIAMIINMLNPGAVVIGGALAAAGDYLMLPLRQSVNKHAIAAAYRDTRFRAAQTDRYDAALGAAILIRNKTLGLL